MKIEGHVTTEKTAKRFKFQLVLCWLAVIVSVIWFMCAKSNAEVQGRAAEYVGPSVLLVAAVVWYVITRIRIWWNHG